MYRTSSQRITNLPLQLKPQLPPLVIPLAPQTHSVPSPPQLAPTVVHPTYSATILSTAEKEEEALEALEALEGTRSDLLSLPPPLIPTKVTPRGGRSEARVA